MKSWSDRAGEGRPDRPIAKSRYEWICPRARYCRSRDFDVGVFEDLFDGFHGLFEEIEVEFFEFGTRQSLADIFTLKKGFDLNANKHS